jgi:hypothetical protein
MGRPWKISSVNPPSSSVIQEETVNEVNTATIIDLINNLNDIKNLVRNPTSHANRKVTEIP